MPNILVVGSVNMDVVAPTNQLPQPGQTILIDDVQLIPGGKGANAAVSAAKFHTEVMFIGAVGNDPFGEALRGGLLNHKIDCTHLETLPMGSGTAIITLDKKTGQNSIMVGPGANAHINLPSSNTPFEWADVLMLQLETPLDINIEAAKRAHTHNCLVILDPAPAFEKLPEELYEYCDVISPNETELALLTGMPVTTTEEAEDAAQKLLSLGAKIVIAKLSNKGALLVTPHESIHFPTYPITPIDTTAAGDAFTGCLASELSKHKDYAKAIRISMGAGALACTKFGAQTSLPTQDELAKFLQKNHVDY